MSEGVVFIIVTFMSFIPSVTSVIYAGVLAVNDVGGWGWFLLLSYLLMPKKLRYDPDKEDSDE